MWRGALLLIGPIGFGCVAKLGRMLRRIKGKPPVAGPRRSVFTRRNRGERRMAGALDGLVVLDLTSFLSGPYCTMLLGDMGADVIKVERPDGGDDARRMPPFVEGRSAPFGIWNRNKRSIALDLKAPADLEVVRRIALRADVLVENFRPGVLERLGLGWEAMAAVNPRLVYASISGFGQTGPWAGHGGLDMMAQGMSGLMAGNGPPDGEPYRLPIAITDVTSGMYAAIAVLGALQARQRTGLGQRIDQSLFESGLALGVYEAAHVFSQGTRPPRMGQLHRGSAPYRVFRTRDGWITLGASKEKFWRALCGIIGRPELAEDPRFAVNAEARRQQCRTDPVDPGAAGGGRQRALAGGAGRGRHSLRAGAVIRRGAGASAGSGAGRGGGVGWQAGDGAAGAARRDAGQHPAGGARPRRAWRGNPGLARRWLIRNGLVSRRGACVNSRSQPQQGRAA